jgi:hypothetical protein
MIPTFSPYQNLTLPPLSSLLTTPSAYLIVSILGAPSSPVERFVMVSSIWEYREFTGIFHISVLVWTSDLTGPVTTVTVLTPNGASSKRRTSNIISVARLAAA